MGQKASPISLRKQTTLPISTEFNFFPHIILLKEYLVNYFYKKGILINNIIIKKEKNCLLIDVDFIISKESSIYNKKFRKKLKKKKRFFKKKKFKQFELVISKLKTFKYFKTKKNKKIFLKKKKFSPLNKFLKHLAKILNIKHITFKAKRLDSLINRKLYHVMLKDLRKIGVRKYIKQKKIQDLLILLCLLLDDKKINANSINVILVKYFSWVPKKRHKKFLYFIKNLFQNIYLIDKKYKSLISGIKLIVAGRISGKNRASNFKSSIGNLRTQTLSEIIDYSLKTCFSKLGTFGWRLYISKTKK